MMEFNAPYDISDFFHSKNIGPGGSNYLRYGSLFLDKLLDRSAETNDVNVRGRLMKDISRFIRDSVPALFIVSEQTAYAYSSRLVIPAGRVDQFDFFPYVGEWYFKGGRER